jgi:hypothetical protein
MKRRLFDLPLGTRFRYLSGRADVYVLIDRGGCGQVAHAPIDDGTGKEFQGIYSAAESRDAARELVVEVVPVREVREPSYNGDQLHAPGAPFFWFRDAKTWRWLVFTSADVDACFVGNRIDGPAVVDDFGSLVRVPR